MATKNIGILKRIAGSMIFVTFICVLFALLVDVNSAMAMWCIGFTAAFITFGKSK